MKKRATLAVLAALALTTVAAREKYALVIGNAAYPEAPLKNTVNDANDMKTALEQCGFQVDCITNGALEPMLAGIERLKRNLRRSRTSYGFFFYSGHGSQIHGENFLIPVDAEAYSYAMVRARCVSLQMVLDELADAGNELNIVILDACRSNPFKGIRDAGRGLAVVSAAYPGSIIMYATAANSVASDNWAGRNGLFTKHLLNQLKVEGLEVTEVFRRTGAAVAEESGNTQYPELAVKFYGTAYLGSAGTQPAPRPQPAPSQDANALSNQGTEHYNREEYDEAIAAFTAALRIDPNHANAKGNLATAYNNRGVAYANRGDYDRALADYTAALRIDPNHAAAYSNRGVAYANRGDYDRALADFTAALRIDPNHAEIKEIIQIIQQARARR
ncbi:MAG: tetratricopeptide repeat protein [Spirochaetaceae bacterium]|nr:tetratricopeptide repeat protein [Spirochaetaceae bacterium]